MVLTVIHRVLQLFEYVAKNWSNIIITLIKQIDRLIVSHHVRENFSFENMLLIDIDCKGCKLYVFDWDLRLLGPRFLCLLIWLPHLIKFDDKQEVPRRGLLYSDLHGNLKSEIMPISTMCTWYQVYTVITVLISQMWT